MFTNQFDYLKDQNRIDPDPQFWAMLVVASMSPIVSALQLLQNSRYRREDNRRRFNETINVTKNFLSSIRSNLEGMKRIIDGNGLQNLQLRIGNRIYLNAEDVGEFRYLRNQIFWWSRELDNHIIKLSEFINTQNMIFHRIDQLERYVSDLKNEGDFNRFYHGATRIINYIEENLNQIENQ